MRILRGAIFSTAVGLAIGTTMMSEPAEAGCRWFKATHNGTDFFYATGSAGTAEHKLNGYIYEWTKAKGIKRVKVYKSKTRCGDWFVKYALPHKHCIAKAKVCY